MTFEIIVPTIPGRERYLAGALDSCLAQDGAAVLVSNNGRSQVVRDLASSIPRVRLVEPDAFLPMPLHWDFAMKHATGDVLTILGDDDAMMPGATATAARVMQEHPDVSALAHSPAQYYWPDYHDPARRDRYTITPGDGSVVEKTAMDELHRVLSFRSWYGVLPFVYHGFVRRDVMRRIAERQDGSIFLKAAPDIYSDMAIAATIERYAVLSGCLTVGGQGARSTGASLFSDRAEGRAFIREMPSGMLPAVGSKSVNLIIYDCIEEVRRQFGLTRSTPFAWRRFTEAVCREAVMLDTGRRREILDGLRQVAVREFRGFQRTAALSAIRLTDLAAAPLAAALRSREAKHIRSMQMAPVAGAWPLAQWLRATTAS